MEYESFVVEEDGDETANGPFKLQLNSTVITTDDDPPTEQVFRKPVHPLSSPAGKMDLKLSPIAAEPDRTPYRMGRRMKEFKLRGQSPLVTPRQRVALSSLFIGVSQSRSITEKIDESNSSGFLSRSLDDESVIRDENEHPGTSTSTPQPTIGSVYSFVNDTNSSRVVNPFELMDSFHKNMFSPNVFSTSQQSLSETQEFQWSIEEMSYLKPAHISDDEIAMCKKTPDPEKDALIQSVLDQYWKNNTCYVPSPDVQPQPHNNSFTPATDIARSAGISCAYYTSSPVQRPGSNARQSIRKRTRCSQTDLTISSTMNVDFSAILGQSCVYKPSDEDDDQYEMNCSSTSGSLRRRLFQDDDSLNASQLTDEDNRSIVREELDRIPDEKQQFALSDFDLSPIKCDDQN